MWWWFRRRRPQPAPAPEPQGVVVRVIGLLGAGYVRVVVGPGIGQLDGGIEQDWRLEWVPLEARFPNREFRMSRFVDGVPQIIHEDPPAPPETPPET